MRCLRRRCSGIVLGCVLLLVCRVADAQTRRVVVVDQTGLPLPGATVQILDAGEVRFEGSTGTDGTVDVPDDLRALRLQVALPGFETAIVDGAVPERIVLGLARESLETVVTAAGAAQEAPAALQGTTLNTVTVTRLPSAHMHAKESLPLLPSVIRGADGLMQLGGARAYQTPLTLDGFNVTDPATGLSSLNLPLEAVLSVEALRDPMAITHGNLLGGVIRLESRAGGPDRSIGVQGFIPRPRFASPGFGRLEGIFPRAHLSGSTAGGQVQYLFSGEYDYERIPVPEVTDRSGKDLIEKSGIFFSRVDAQLTTRSATTFEAFSFPTGTVSHGLSPRREEAAAVNLHGHDLFGGVTHRVMLANTGVVTWRLGAFARSAGMDAKGGTAVSVLTHVGWGQNWFASGSRHSQRLSTSLAWDRTVTMRERSHELSALTEVAALKMNGEIVERPVHVLDDAGNLVRKVTFGGSAALRSRDVMVSAALRDVWHVTDRAQVDLGVRLDSSFETSTVPSARVGLRYVLDQSGRTTLKGGAGMFVGVVPLAAMAFGGYPVRSDASFDAAGTPTGTTVLTPSVGRLSLPRAYTGVVALEREIAPGLDGQMVVTLRNSYQLPKLNVPAGTGDLRVDSSGRSTYRELQLSVRKTWPHDQLLFVSYVLSSAVGELNEFATLFQNMDAPLLNAGGRARSTNDARHRVLAWGTFNLPLRTVISPVTEWHSGFTYSSYSSRYTYTGTPNSREFPRFLSTDMVAYKTVTVRGRTADVGFQLFNVFNNRNPRDVFPVAGTARYGEFANSVGRILRGYILVKW